jgi:hypothetical protein
MRRATVTFGALAIAGFLAAGVSAQKTTQIHPGKGGSPHEKTEWTVDGANISVTYGRPYLKGRDLAKLTPAGKVWRTGADEATTLTTDRPLTFGSVKVPAGTYTLFTIPSGDEWQLIINRQTGQWGTQYDESKDLGRVPMKASKTASPVEQLTISIEDTAQGGVLRIDWGGVRASAPFTVG